MLKMKRCKRCNKKLVFSPESAMLICPQCGGTGKEKGSLPDEIRIVSENPEPDSHGLPKTLRIRIDK